VDQQLGGNNLVGSILPRGSLHQGTSLVVTRLTTVHLDGTAVDAQFMRSNEDKFIAAHDGFKVLVMPCAVVAATGTARSVTSWISGSRLCSILPEQSCRTCWRTMAATALETLSIWFFDGLGLVF
jgi:hypothetical protein